MKKKNEVVISKNFIAMAIGFILGFGIAFAISWNTVSYLVEILVSAA